MTDDNDTRAKLKRVADFLEKLAVAAAFAAVFQYDFRGFIWCVVFLVLSLALTSGERK